MPTNKLWIEHTERAAWDSVEALRERLTKAESRLQALAAGVDRVPELLELLDAAKARYAPEARGYDAIVAGLLQHIEQLERDLQAAKTPTPTVVTFSAPLPRPRLDSDDLAESGSRSDDEDFDLGAFAHSMQRREEQGEHRGEATPTLERLLTLAEQKLDDLNELEGGALREAALDLAILAGRIHAASRRST